MADDSLLSVAHSSTCKALRVWHEGRKILDHVHSIDVRLLLGNGVVSNKSLPCATFTICNQGLEVSIMCDSRNSLRNMKSGLDRPCMGKRSQGRATHEAREPGVRGRCCSLLGVCWFKECMG